MVFKFVSLPVFIISIAVGLFFVYLAQPAPRLYTSILRQIILAGCSTRTRQTTASSSSPRKFVVPPIEQQ